MDELSLFNINASIGKGAYEEPDYKTVSDLLAHMDYLDVDRSLVWHVEARDLNPTLGNKRLLQEINEAKASERLVPAFVITPSCYFEDGALDFLLESFSLGRVRALRICPEVSRYPIRQLERVLGELAAFEPVVLWDCPTFAPESDFQGLIALARKYPQIKFVITQKMWPGFGAVLDAMWRCENISVDISWLHMRDTIELLVREFSAKRVLFGLGYKTHYGAANAMLAHAKVRSYERELIAHGNIERMLGLRPIIKKLATPPAILDEKPLWKKFVSGHAIDDIKIVDGHTHLGPHTRGWVLPENDLVENKNAMLKQMDELGINSMILSPGIALFSDCPEGNRRTAELLKEDKGRFYGYLVYNPLYADEMNGRLDDFFKDPFFVGFKLLPSYWKTKLDSAAFEPVWKYANEHKLPILIHTWDDKYNSPARLNDIAPRYPQAKFLLGHSGGGTKGRLEAEELALNNKNVYLEFCGTFTSPRGFEQSAELVGWDRVIFGTDTDAHSAAWEMGHYLSMPVADSILQAGLSKNFEQIMVEAKKQI